MLYQVIEDGEITESYAMPDHDETHHLVTAGMCGEIRNTSSNITFDKTHFTVLVNASGGAVVISLPPAASCEHRIYNIKKIDSSANTVTIDAHGAIETIDGSLTKVISVQWDSYTIQSNGTIWYII